jgi:hypothetical protein
VWGLSRETVGHVISKVMRDPSSEFFSNIELDAFAQQLANEASYPPAR